MPLTLTHNALVELHPCGVVKRPCKNSEEVKWDTMDLPGKWMRVFPQTAEDVRFLLNLEHGLDKVAPASGHGVLVAARCIPTPISR